MSLVVAQATEFGPRITSDIQVSRWDERNPILKNGTLKTIVLSQTVAICFAGNVAEGLQGVREFSSGLNAGRSIDDLLPALGKVSASGSADFIVAQRDRVNQLTRVTELGIEYRLPIAWIGDQKGFEQFQRARNLLSPDSGSDNTPQTVMSTLRKAMRAVIDDPSIQNVGGFEVAVANTQVGFEYLGSVFAHPGQSVSISMPVDDLIPYMIQPAEQGGYTACLVEPVLAGVPAAAVYFPTGRLALMFLPLEFDTAQVVTNIQPAEFVSTIQDRFGIALKPPGGPLQQQILANG